VGCPRCGQPIDAAGLSCPACHALVYQVQLDAQKAQALALEKEGQFSRARDVWMQMLVHLPAGTKQATWIVGRIHELTDVPDRGNDSAAEQPAPSWVAKLGPLAPIAIALIKGKGLLALLNAKTLLSLGVFTGFYSGQLGWRLGLGLAVSILIHEMGHYVDIRRRGLPADMPVFLPGLGAYVRWRAMDVPPRVIAGVSLAGPMAGGGAALCTAVLYVFTGAPYWAAITRLGAWLNLLNLAPVWPLDGGQAARVLTRAERVMLLSASAVLWLITGEGLLLIVTAVAVWRVFQRERPRESSRGIAATYLAVLAALAGLLWLTPGTGAGLE
jgi:Zn-dependent protease